MRASEHTLKYNREANCFNEALPLGNGRIGGMIYGGIKNEKISLNEDTFWSGYPEEKDIEGYPQIYQDALALFDKGEISEAQKLLENNFGDSLVQMYLPLANLKMCVEHEDGVLAARYNRMLKLNSAVHFVNYVMNGQRYERESFISEPYQVLAMRMTCSKQESISFCVTLESAFSTECEKAPDGQGIFLKGIAPIAFAEYGKAYSNVSAQIFDGKGITFGSVVQVDAKGGMVTTGTDFIRVEKADEAILYVAIRTNFKGYDTLPSGEEFRQLCFQDIKKAMNVPYEMLKKESIRAHRRLYNRCQISLGGERRTRVTTDMRLKRLAEGEKDTALYTLLFNYGKYLTIAGSRTNTQVMNLQGIWNDKLLPPWNCNYTLNINTEMNYWPTLTMGLFECYEPFVRFVEELYESGKQTAKEYYGIDGWVCHHSSDLWRLTHPGTNRLPNNAQWGFWNMASGWLAIMLWDFYRYTLDVKYLKRVFPIIVDAAKFYQQLLVECNGELILSPSTSPENKYIGTDNVVYAIDKSTAMSQEILYDLFVAIGDAAKVLSIKNEFEGMESQLKRPFIQENGELCEWDSVHDVWDIHHRHVSHLYGLFPSKQFLENAIMKDACRKVLLSRGDGGTGWALAWKINLWARLEDGEHALNLLRNQLRFVSPSEEAPDVGGGSYPNLFCAHPPFQIDGNMGAANGILEMLIQTDKDGNPILLPALPKEWETGSVKGVRIPGNRKISFSWREGKIYEVWLF